GYSSIRPLSSPSHHSPALLVELADSEVIATFLKGDTRSNAAGGGMIGVDALVRIRPPADVAIVVLTPRVFELAGEQRYSAEGIDITLLHIQCAHDDTDVQGWLTVFSTARGGQSQGVISLIF